MHLPGRSDRHIPTLTPASNVQELACMHVGMHALSQKHRDETRSLHCAHRVHTGLFLQVEAALSSNKPCDAAALASSAVKDAYRKATGTTPEKSKPDAAEGAGPPPDEDCPICYEDFKVGMLPFASFLL
jgi:hypothetical protein